MNSLYLICACLFVVPDLTMSQVGQFQDSSAAAKNPIDSLISVSIQRAKNSYKVSANSQPQSRNSETSNKIVQFYESAVKGNFFSGGNGKYEFKASLYGLEGVFHDSLWTVDTVYLRGGNYWTRNTNISVNLSSDQNGGINGLTPTINCAIINNRDRTTKNFFDALEPYWTKIDGVLLPASSVLNTMSNHAMRDSLQINLRNCLQHKDFSGLDRFWLSYIDVDSLKKILSSINDYYEDVAKSVDQSSLWTIGVGGGFPKGAGDSLFLNTEYHHGLFEGKDLVLSGTLAVEDTANNGLSKINRIQWLLSAGSDFVILRANKDSSLVEGNFSLQDEGIPMGLKKGENNNEFDLALTITPLISKNLYLPFTIKYDPRMHNFLGFLELQFDFKPPSSNAVGSE